MKKFMPSESKIHFRSIDLQGCYFGLNFWGDGSRPAKSHQTQPAKFRYLDFRKIFDAIRDHEIHLKLNILILGLRGRPQMMSYEKRVFRFFAPPSPMKNRCHIMSHFLMTVFFRKRRRRKFWGYVLRLHRFSFRKID